MGLIILDRMPLKKLHDPNNGQMRVAGFMSGSGSNLRKIIEHEDKLESLGEKSPYQVVVIFSDNTRSNAKAIGEEHGIDVIENDIREFYGERGRPINDLELRAEFDAETVRLLSPYKVDVIAYAGYMKIVTQPLMDAYLGVNVHPADLSETDGHEVLYTGAHAVKKALLAGESQLRSTTHIVEPKVDYGRILMVSSPLDVTPLHKILSDPIDDSDDSKVNAVINNLSGIYQAQLKEIGDWVIFPKTLGYIATGRYSQNSNGNLYFDGKPIPDGVRLE